MKKRYLILLSLVMMLGGCKERGNDNSFQQNEITAVKENFKENQNIEVKNENEIYQTKYVTLEKIGEFADDEKLNIRDDEIFFDGPVKQSPETDYQVCDYLGNPIDMINYDGIWNDVVLRYKYDEASDTEYMGIDDWNGNALVPLQAVVERTWQHRGWNPYLAFTSKDDHYVRIFDSKEKRLLDIFNIDAQKQEFGFSDKLVWIKEMGTEEYMFYNSQGEFIESMDYRDAGMYEDEVGHVDGDFIIRGNEIYDINGQFLFSFSTNVVEVRNVPGDDKLFIYCDVTQDPNYGIADAKGNIIVTGEYIYAHGNGMYTVETGENNLLLIGNFVVPWENVYFYVNKYGVQVWRDSETESGRETTELWIMESQEFVPYPGEYLELGVDTENSWGFVKFEKNESYKCGLRECFSGEVILPAEYDQIEFCYDRVYALKDEMWSVFEVVDFVWPDLSEVEQQRIGSIAVEVGEKVSEIS